MSAERRRRKRRRAARRGREQGQTLSRLMEDQIEKGHGGFGAFATVPFQGGKFHLKKLIEDLARRNETKRDIVQRLSALHSLRICAFVRRSFVVSVRRSRRTNGFVRIFAPPTDVQHRSNQSLGLVIVAITVTSPRTHFDELALQTNRLTIDLIEPVDPLLACLRQRFIVVQIEGAQQFRLFRIVHAEILAEQLSVEFRNRSKAAQWRFSQSICHLTP